MVPQALRMAESAFKRYKTRDPFEIMDARRVLLKEFAEPRTLLGFFTVMNRRQVIGLNRAADDVQRLTGAIHELGHSLNDYRTAASGGRFEDCKFFSLSNAPSEAQLNAARSTDRWKLENNVLTVSDATAAKQSRELSRSVVTAGEGADVLYYVERTYTGAYLLQSEALPVELSPLELGPVATLHDIAVSQPISITASNTAVTIVDADRSVEVVSLADRSVTRLPAISTKTAAAA
jgi:hypothetical protein